MGESPLFALPITGFYLRSSVFIGGFELSGTF